MKVNAIFDSRRQEYYDPLIETLQTQGITDYEIWPCLILPTVIESINASHKMIVRQAKEFDLPEVCIWEADCMIPAKDGWQKFLEDMPPWKFDLYLAGTYGLNKPITGKIDKINGIHSYIIRKQFYDTFLSVPDHIHIDVALDNLGLYYVRYPFIAIQRPGWSANSRAFSDKNAQLSDEDVYGGLP